MHERKLRVQALRPALASGARGALPLVRGASITMQVMLEVSLRARWDATLVVIIVECRYHIGNRSSVLSYLKYHTGNHSSALSQQVEKR